MNAYQAKQLALLVKTEPVYSDYKDSEIWTPDRLADSLVFALPEYKLKILPGGN